MVGIVVVVVVGHEPFVNTEYTARFEHAEDLAVYTFERGGVDGGFDGVDCVEGVLGEGHLLFHWLAKANMDESRRTHHEITLDVCQLVSQSLLLGIPCGTINLVVIVVQSGDVCTRKFGNLSCGSTHTTSNIEDFITVFDADFGGEVVFVAGNGLIEGFTVCETAEVE